MGGFAGGLAGIRKSLLNGGDPKRRTGGLAAILRADGARDAEAAYLVGCDAPEGSLRDTEGLGEKDAC